MLSPATVPCNFMQPQTVHHRVSTVLLMSAGHHAGVTSVYRWKGEVNEDQEELLMIKSLQELVPELTQWVKREHPYDDCEVSHASHDRLDSTTTSRRMDHHSAHTANGGACSVSDKLLMTQVISVPVTGGSSTYLQWVHESVKSAAVKTK